MVTHSSAEIFHAVSDATRRAILDRLSAGPVPVAEIASRFPVSRPAVSKHLRVLRESGLVSEVREGRQRLYSLNAAPLGEIDRWLNQYRRFWEVNLNNLKKLVERSNQSSGKNR